MLNLTPSTLPEDMARSRSWVGTFFTSPTSLPVSFCYDENLIAGIPADWNPVIRKSRIDANVLQTVYEGAHTPTGLEMRVESLEYLDFPVVEWTAWLSNTGDRTTPIIRDFLAVDGSFAGTVPVLVHCNGDFYSDNGYTPQESLLPDGEGMVFSPTGGRPCDGAYPYFRLLFGDGGLALAVGWPGQWSASFQGVGGGVRVTAGQEKVHLRLSPGETIRSPRIAILSWAGNAARGVNLWRRWYLGHILPRPDGRPLQPRLALAATDTGEEFTAATQENQLRYMDKFKAAGFDFDVWWIDAGWYPCYNEKYERRWWQTGTWMPDPDRFPNGFKPISANAAKYGARLLVWFEPERVTPGSWLDQYHPEWLLRAPGESNRLLNLGNPACRQWLTDHVCQLIQEDGIGIYRQDFNFEPLKFWRENEAPDRQGMNENLHVQGYLQYWDELLRRNPDLWIDSCSSGGRRNDLETMRRSVPLHYTDYGYGIHPIKLAFHHTLFEWIPYFKECTLSWDQIRPGEDTRWDKGIDSFSYHCGLAAMLFPIIDIRREDYDFPLARKLIRIWRKAAEYFLWGDYYPLTPSCRQPERWVAWQFDRPESGDGLVQAIRLAGCPMDHFIACLKGLDSQADYVLENPESGETLEIPATTLLNQGFAIELPARSGAIWFYRRKTGIP